MWNPKQAHQDEDDDDDDSWEIRAFAEDTGNIMGTTWPPRFYTCTFCSREFRSAQALGGHMNVHRRDRIRFHHQQTRPNSTQPISSSTSSFTIPTTEAVYGSDGFCFFYKVPDDNNGCFFNPTNSGACFPSSIATPYPSNSPTASSFPSIRSPGDQLRGTSRSSSHCSQISSKGDESLLSIDDNGDEKLDLELRLGHRPSPA